MACLITYKSNHMKEETIAPSVLLLNDIHVSKDNIPEFQKNWDEAISICKEKGVLDMVIGGDLWLSRSAQTLSTLLAVRQAIIKATNAGITLLIAEGNHDLVDQESLLGYSHIFSEYPHVYVVDDYDILDLSKQTVLYVMSYFPENGSFTQRLKELVKNKVDYSKRNILYIHEGINGALAVAREDELPTNIFNDFDRVLVGHYHNRCVIKNTNIEYIGSSRQHNFGEDEEKGYTLLYNDGSYEFIKNQVNTRYKVVDVTADQINDDLFKLLDNIKADGRYKVKVRVSCNSREASSIDKLKLTDAGAAKVELVTEDMTITENVNHALDKKFDKSGIKQEYAVFCSDKGITDVEMGLQYLDKIN